MSSVIFNNVSKSFLRGAGVSSSLIETLYKGSRNLISRLNGLNDKASDQLFWALKNVSFEVKPGEAFAIIGPNGAGKSTALKLLSRVSMPTKGSILARGKMACLIELGAGFHPELTGRENIYLYGSIMGMKQADIKKSFEEIVDFSGISDFLDTPIKRYSSGMHARLGFSVAIHTRPDILLVDEVLAVGDWSFQQKCYVEMEKYLKRGTTIVFVTHNMDAIRSVCERGILLAHGEIAISGAVEDVIDGYYKSMESAKTLSGNEDYKHKAKMNDFRLIGDDGKLKNAFKSGEHAVFSYTVTFFEDVDQVEFGFIVCRKDMLLIASTGSKDLGIPPKSVKKGKSINVEFPFRVNLLAGSYTVGGEIRSQHFSEYLDMNIKPISFQVLEDYSHGGVADLKPKCRLI